MPLAVFEHSLDINGTFLEILENIALAMIYLVGMWHFDEYSLKDSVFCLQ